MKIRNVLILFILCAILPATIHAQEENEENKFAQPIQEFFFSEPVYLQDQNELQQTLHGIHFENDEEISNVASYEAEFGATDWLQFAAGYSFEHHNIKDIPFDSSWLETSLAVGLFNNAKNAATFSFEAEFPVKKPDVEDVEAEDTPSYTPGLTYAVQFYKTQLHISAATELQEDETTWYYDAAAVYGEGNIHPVVEINTVSEEDDFLWYAGTGIVLNGESGWEFGAGYRHQIDAAEWQANLHLIYEFTFGNEE